SRCELAHPHLLVEWSSRASTRVNRPGAVPPMAWPRISPSDAGQGFANWQADQAGMLACAWANLFAKFDLPLPTLHRRGRAKCERRQISLRIRNRSIDQTDK